MKSDPQPAPRIVELSAAALQSLDRVREQAHRHRDLWIFAYGSLIWQPDFEVAESRLAKLQGWHRGLKMWSRINRGTPEQPGLVFALLPGGAVKGLVMRPSQLDDAFWMRLWQREMPSCVYEPRWLRCMTSQCAVQALAFTLSKKSPNFTGNLPPERLRAILRDRQGGRYGHTYDYALRTHQSLLKLGIHDHALARMLSHAGEAEPPSGAHP